MSKSIRDLCFVLIGVCGPLATLAHATPRQVPEMDAGAAAMGIGLTLGIVALIRDRKRSS